MARDRFQGRHRVSRKAKLTTGGIGLAVLTVGALAVFTTTGSPPEASADSPDQSQFVDITTVEPNVNEPDAQQDASTGTSTVDCGRNENGHFNPDNFIAQPGVRNGAQHLHDYVGNLSTDADSNNQSLQAAGTTCANGDKSAYFWPVVRIDTEGDSEEEQQQDNAEEAQAEEAGRGGAQNQDGRQVGQRGAQNGQNDGQNGDQAQDDQGDGQAPGDQNQGDQNGGQNQDAQDQGAQGQQDQQGQDQDGEGQQGQGGQDGQGDQGQNGQDQGGQGDQGQNEQGQDGQGQDGQGGQNQDGQNQGDQGQDGQGEGQGGQDQGQGDQGQGGNEDEALPPQDENGELPGNEGEIQRPSVVDITFRGSPVTEVEAMPKFLRVLYGDAKVSTNGPANAQESWTCTGFEDQVRIDKYTICPEGSDVMRVHDFPSCWDGQNIDSENHRDHIVYPNENGQCEDGFTAVPQLRISLTYEIPREVQLAGQYKVDAFPEEDHNPLSDHDDFANVMSNAIMTRVVDCINSGRTCNE
ncbi:DUF1996 domain-containing protein [Amycolatopsis sp. 195334CR]|uniref:DUF1996 domain-containing protein n=1 Tax=Amycolatopsis sp. 195334CR TaxID=2814588 RepID=UPI001A8C4BD8|nr:DUF1996 domain-containing protein [Amycolatopsis sp. 195334CR]MBN6036798.1 DUF1996 domain-containing protein [Amycolatopsis sp. 195334CR]